MDPLEELALMASNATQTLQTTEITPEEIQKWQTLFSYTREQAIYYIDAHHQDLSRTHISDSHWELVRGDWEPRGHDRSTYEHYISTTRPEPKTTKTFQPLTAKQARTMYIVKLEDPLSTPTIVKSVSRMSNLPDCVQGEDGDGGEATFCYVNGLAKQAITEWITIKSLDFSPTFTQIPQKAEKNFSNSSCFPTLGVDSTLPQYREKDGSGRAVVEPAQDQYPVWYLFYGTLADPEIFSGKLGLSNGEMSRMWPASVYGGKIKIWGGKYKALVDATADEVVKGSAYEIMSKEQEDALRVYETDNYEVVRCVIRIEGGNDGEYREVKGCTFRFVGDLGG